MKIRQRLGELIFMSRRTNPLVETMAPDHMLWPYNELQALDQPEQSRIKISEITLTCPKNGEQPLAKWPWLYVPEVLAESPDSLVEAADKTKGRRTPKKGQISVFLSRLAFPLLLGL